MTVTYSTTSPYSATTFYGNYLDVWTQRTLPYLSTDVQYQIDQVYSMRPDLLAADLYGDANLWWVFAVRNPNIIQDPVFDFTAGTIIYVPSMVTLTTALGT